MSKVIHIQASNNVLKNMKSTCTSLRRTKDKIKNPNVFLMNEKFRNKQTEHLFKMDFSEFMPSITDATTSSFKSSRTLQTLNSDHDSMFIDFPNSVPNPVHNAVQIPLPTQIPLLTSEPIREYTHIPISKPMPRFIPTPTPTPYNEMSISITKPKPQLQLQPQPQLQPVPIVTHTRNNRIQSKKKLSKCSYRKNLYKVLCLKKMIERQPYFKDKKKKTRTIPTKVMTDIYRFGQTFNISYI
jgi:hypothetical protein